MKQLDNSWYTRAHYDIKFPKKFPNPYIEKYSEFSSGYIEGVLDFREKVIQSLKSNFIGEDAIKDIENLKYE